ncbi:MAG: hypothetical protein IH945_05535 [Armatimonadetes bacterium]|nr:hypothetical protein [Armatimonadota bacterium]
MQSAMHPDFGWTFPTGSFVNETEGDDGATVETIELTDNYRMTRTIDRPGDEDDDVFTGIWEQTYDGVRLQISRHNGASTEGEAYLKFDESNDTITEKIDDGRTFSRVLDTGASDQMTGEPE